MVCVIASVLPAAGFSQGPKRSLPDPVKFVTKFDVAWNVVRAVLDSMGYATELEDKRGGRVVTKPHEFITGSLTASEIDKVAVKRDSITGNWLKARYSAEVLLEHVSPTETLVTVRTRMEGLIREVDGTQKWMPLESLGAVERQVLGKISMKILGAEPEFDSKKGFWDKTPQPVDPRQAKPTRTPPPQH